MTAWPSDMRRSGMNSSILLVSVEGNPLKLSKSSVVIGPWNLRFLGLCEVLMVAIKREESSWRVSYSACDFVPYFILFCC